MAVDTPEQGWVVLAAETTAVEVIQAAAADEAVLPFIVEGKPYWSHTSKAIADNITFTWLTAGTIPDWGGTPLVLVITLEESNAPFAELIRNKILDAAINQ